MDAESTRDQQKRAAEDSNEERLAKQMRMDTRNSSSASNMDAMAISQAITGISQQQNNLYFGESNPTAPQSIQLPVQQSLESMGLSVPKNQAQYMQMQIQQRQQQQQYAAALAARHSAQHQQQRQYQAATTTPMVNQQSDPSVANYQSQMYADTGTNIHVVSVVGPQDENTSAISVSGASVQPQQSSETQIFPQQENADNSATSFTSQPSIAPGIHVSLKNSTETCYLCGKSGDTFTCNGGCGLHVHPACIGKDAIFPFVVGQLCGSCFIVQQNRASPEDLTKGGPHALSVRRAILCVNLETNSNANFDKFGHLASLRLGEIGSIAGYPVKPFAEKFVEPYLQRWMREKLAAADKWMLNVREIFTVMIGLYSLKRACIAHGLHDKVISLMKSRKFTVTDFFGWHPAVETPNVRCSSLCAICGIRNNPEVDVCSRCHHKLVFPSVFTKYISTLLAAFYAEQVGIPLGASSLDVFAHTQTVRGLYKGLNPFDADGVNWDLFTDQLRMIFGLLDIMSNFGTLQLKPALFIPETNIIFNAAYVNQAMITNEFEVVGKFLQCMKLFGREKSEENKNMIESCERYLLFKHLPDGSWCKMNGSTVDQYKATVTCSKALLTPAFRGYGPESNDFLRLLEKWSRNASPAKQSADSTDLKILASGAVVKRNTLTRFKRFEAMYQRQVAPKGSSFSLESLITNRMQRILKSKEAEAQLRKDRTSGKEEGFGDGMTDTEDVKIENQTLLRNGTNDATGRNDQDDDDMLTSMSLHEDLEIFDGLQFEDGGGIIDMSFQSLGSHEVAENESGEHNYMGADSTDAQQGEDETTMNEEMVDDDDDENDDSKSQDADGEVHQSEAHSSTAEKNAGSVEATTDFLVL
ncbi:hypothetical protein Plhal710r2_c050g0155991 [Plasmopara halstedii]